MFPLKFRDEIKMVRKIQESEFSRSHREMIAHAEYQDGCLLFPETGWTTSLLGAGEEKAVFVICDNSNRVFAIEVIDQRTYLNGRFVGGQYFFESNAPALQNVKYSPKAIVGLTFTGLVKAREFVYGYEWARFQYSPRKKGTLDGFLTSFLQAVFASQFSHYRAQYKDVHERNIMFEIRQRQEKGIPAIIKDWRNKTILVKVGLQPIDVR